ncbi:hypothetical protein D3C80_1982930 [compost metagenome]
MQHVLGTHQHLHRAVQRQAQLVAADQHVILAERICGIEAEGILAVDPLDVRAA